MRFLLLAASSFFLLSCMSSRAEDSSGSIAWREVASGSHSNIKQASRQVIRDQQQWIKWWQQHNKVQMHIDGKTVPKPPPEVDFEQEMVLVATLGQRSTGGYSIRFTEIRREGDVVTATLQISSPGPDDLVTQALTSPFAVIAIPQHAGRVKFVEETVK